MSVRLGVAHYWRGVTVLFGRGDADVLHRMAVYPEGESVHDLICTGPNRFFMLHDSYVAGRYVAAFEYWDFKGNVFYQFLLPHGILWGKILTSPNADFYAVIGQSRHAVSYMLFGRVGQPGTLLKFAWPTDIPTNTYVDIADVADDGGVFVVRRGRSSKLVTLFRFVSGVQNGQHIRAMSEDEFPFIKEEPFCTPAALNRRQGQRCDFLTDGEMPGSSAGAQMETSQPVEMVPTRLPVHLHVGDFEARS